MNSITTADLRALADAATPGPYHLATAPGEGESKADYLAGTLDPDSDAPVWLAWTETDREGLSYVVPLLTGDGPRSEANARYFSALDPSVVRALCDAVDGLEDLRNRRLMSAIFGTPEGLACAKPFGVYQHPESGIYRLSKANDVGEVIAHGAEFPDGTVALCWVRETETMLGFKNEGLASLQEILDREGDMQIVWYTEELEPLAAMEELIDRVLAIAEKPPVGFPLPTRTRLEESFNDGVAVMAAQVRDLIKAARAVTP